MGGWSTSGPQVRQRRTISLELACHVSWTRPLQVRCHPRVPVSDRQVPVPTLLSHATGTPHAGDYLDAKHGQAQDRRCLPRLLRLVTVERDRGSALGLLYFAAVQHSSRVGRDHLIRGDLQPHPLPVHSAADLLNDQ